MARARSTSFTFSSNSANLMNSSSCTFEIPFQIETCHAQASPRITLHSKGWAQAHSLLAIGFLINHSAHLHYTHGRIPANFLYYVWTAAPEISEACQAAGPHMARGRPHHASLSVHSLHSALIDAPCTRHLSALHLELGVPNPRFHLRNTPDVALEDVPSPGCLSVPHFHLVTQRQQHLNDPSEILTWKQVHKCPQV